MAGSMLQFSSETHVATIYLYLSQRPTGMMQTHLHAGTLSTPEKAAELHSVAPILCEEGCGATKLLPLTTMEHHTVKTAQLLIVYSKQQELWPMLL